jgi:hypothetical protein
MYFCHQPGSWELCTPRVDNTVTWAMTIKSNAITGLDGPCGFQKAEAPRFQDSRHMKVVRLSALLTGRLYPPGNIPGRAQLKPDGTRWRTVGEVKGNHASGVGSQYSCTLPQNTVYPALLSLLPLMPPPRLPVVAWPHPPPPPRPF